MNGDKRWRRTRTLTDKDKNGETHRAWPWAVSTAIAPSDPRIKALVRFLACRAAERDHIKMMEAARSTQGSETKAP